MSTAPPEPPPEDDRPPAPPGPPGGSAAPPPPPPSAPGGFSAPPPPPSAPGGGGFPESGSGYGAPPPGGQQMGYGSGAAMADGSYADWPKRALSGLIDFFGPFLVAAVFYRVSTGLGLLAYAAALAWAVYNAYLGGQTGQSYGKKIAGTRLVSEATGMPPGGGLGIGRYFLHVIDSLPCYLGFLWPLWDGKKQTFSDKVLKTVVVTA